MEGNIFNVPWPWTILSPEEEIVLEKIIFQKSKDRVEALTQALTTTEKAFEEYKKAYYDPHNVYIRKVKEKKKARRLRNKAKGPRK
jgi:hypothetical protein